MKTQVMNQESEERMYTKFVVKDGAIVEWSKIYSMIREKIVTSTSLLEIVVKYYDDKHVISNIRCYKFLNMLVREELATVDSTTGVNKYYIK